jgi:hypothetical protein
MDDFAVKIQENLESSTSNNSSRFKRIREMVSNIVVLSPAIKITEKIDERGNIKIEVSMQEMGISFETIMNYQSELFSDYMSNFLGEMLVRENIDAFAKIIMGINPEDYNDMVNRYDHRVFGMQIIKNKIVFSFHISLIQKILTEDFKKGVSKINES